MRPLLALAGALLLAVLLGSTATAQKPISDDEVNTVAKKLYCPVCDNTPLDVCPTQACKDWREMIRQQLGDGWTERQVLDYFVANYGEQVLAEPPARGFGVLVWLLPVIGLVGGGVFLWRLLRRWQARHGLSESLARGRTSDQRAVPGAVVAGEAAAVPGASTEILARIQREVEERF